MPARLYLDTARLGLLTPSARQIQIDFAHLTSEEAGSLYLEHFLRGGFSAWPHSLQERYPSLRHWQGVTSLQGDFSQLTGSSIDAGLLLAQRSAVLLKLAAQLLRQRCRHILTTDLSWPCYQQSLHRQTFLNGCGLTQLPLRRFLFETQADHRIIAARIIRTYLRNGCDGLFLPAVNHQGIRLPIPLIVQQLRQQAPVRFVVIDGAQALGHIPIDFQDQWGDLFLAGCHKWLGAYHPLGLMFYGHSPVASELREDIQAIIGQRSLDDPLLRFTQQLTERRVSRWGETVGLLPLLTAQAALVDCRERQQHPLCSLTIQWRNAERLIPIAQQFGWSALEPASDVRSGILLLQANSASWRRLAPQEWRERFHQVGMAVTAYRQGIVRISLPCETWTDEIDSQLHHAFQALIQSCHHVTQKVPAPFSDAL